MQGRKPAVTNDRNSLLVPHARYIAVIEDREDSPWVLDGSEGRLIQKPPHLAVALRRAVTMVDSRGLLLSWADTDPGVSVR